MNRILTCPLSVCFALQGFIQLQFSKVNELPLNSDEPGKCLFEIIPRKLHRLLALYPTYVQEKLSSPCVSFLLLHLPFDVSHNVSN